MALLALTDTQWRVVGFMRQQLVEFDRLPTHQQIADHFGWASPNAALDVQKMLVKKGALERLDGGRVRFARGGLDAQALTDEALELEIRAAGLRLRAARLQEEQGSVAGYSDNGAVTRCEHMQRMLIAARSGEQVRRMELERGLTDA